MVKVEASTAYETSELSRVDDTTYQGTLTAPTVLKTDGVTTMTLAVAATGDNGEVTEETREVYVKRESLDLRVIGAKETGEEIGYIDAYLDMDIGDTMDFELHLPATDAQYTYGCRIFIPGTEFGGLLEELEVQTKEEKCVWRGYTWRGLLTQKAVKPPEGSDHLVLNGDLNEALGQLVSDRFGSLFRVSEETTGITVENEEVARYVLLYDAIMNLLEKYGYRLNIAYIQPENLEYGYVELKAVPVTDWSEELEYSQDGNVNLTVKDYRRGINHLVCAGEGEGQDRIILDLYVQADGSIGTEQYYTGLAEREAVYEYTGADLEELQKNGTERLKELKN